MNGPKMGHYLIEHILAPQGSQDIQATHEIINFMDEMPGGFLIYRMGGTEEIIYANKALLRIFQCATLEEFRELTGNSFQGMVHPEDLETVEQSIMEQIANSQYDLDYVEYRIIPKNGEVRWVEDYGHCLHLEHVGDVFYVFISDATEKRNLSFVEKTRLMEEKIQKEEKLKSLMEEFDKERSLINQEHLRRLEVIEGLSVNYESILYADLDADRILPYRLSDRTEKQFEKKFQMRRFHWYTSDYVSTWVHPEDQALVTKVSSPEYIRKRLAKSKTYYTNYRVVNRGELQYLQLRIVNVGSGRQPHFPDRHGLPEGRRRSPAGNGAETDFCRRPQYGEPCHQCQKYVPFPYVPRHADPPERNFRLYCPCQEIYLGPWGGGKIFGQN